MSTAHAGSLVATSDGCPIDGLRGQISAMLGEDPFDDAGAARLTVEIHGLGARIALGDGRGRTLGPAADCTDLIASIALIAAIALTGSPTTPEPEPRVERASQPVVETAAILAAAGSVDGDRPRGQVMAGAQWRRGSRSIATELVFELPERTANGAIEVLRAEVAVSPCTYVRTFGICGLIGVGVIHGRAAGVVLASSETTPVALVAARLTWERGLTARLSLRLHWDLDLMLTETRFDLDEMTVWKTARFETRIGAGVLGRFW